MTMSVLFVVVWMLIHAQTTAGDRDQPPPRPLVSTHTHTQTHTHTHTLKLTVKPILTATFLYRQFVLNNS